MPFQVEYKIMEYADVPAANAALPSEIAAGWEPYSIARGAVSGYAVLYRRQSPP